MKRNTLSFIIYSQTVYKRLFGRIFFMYSLVHNVAHFVGGPNWSDCSFSPVFLAKGMVREAREFGETLKEHVNMTHRRFYEDSV